MVLMDKKNRLLVVIIIIVFVSGLGLIIYKVKQSTSPLVGPIVKENEAPKLITWEDPAGFSFSYPQKIEIDPHEEDKENYAHLELTSLGHSGKIMIWVKETDYLEIEDWAEEEVIDGVQVFDTELGGEPAKKIAYTEPEKLVVAAIDVDALVLIEMFPDEESYWQKIYNQILDSFTFIPLEGEEAPAPATTGGGDEGIIWEAEEVIE